MSHPNYYQGQRWSRSHCARWLLAELHFSAPSQLVQLLKPTQQGLGVTGCYLLAFLQGQTPHRPNPNPTSGEEQTR